jgi:hypothetical protein
VISQRDLGKSYSVITPSSVEIDFLTFSESLYLLDYPVLTIRGPL